MIIEPGLRPVLRRYSDLTDELVLNAARYPSSEWVITSPDSADPSSLRVVVKQYQDGPRYLAVISKAERARTEEIDAFFPVPTPVLGGEDARPVMEDLCQRHGLVLRIRGGRPTQLAVNEVWDVDKPMEIFGAVDPKDPLTHMYGFGRFTSKGKYWVYLAFNMDIGSILKAFETDP